MNEKDKIIEAINTEFKGLEFDYIEYNERYEDYELHFKGGKYFTLGVKLEAQFRKITYYNKEEVVPNE